MQKLIQHVILSILLICFACDNSRPSNSTSTHSSIDTNQSIFIDESVLLSPQSETYILGDKILLSQKPDENGLKSPDTIVVLAGFDDSLNARQTQQDYSESVEFLPTVSYYYPGLNHPFLLYKKPESNSSIADSSSLTKIYKIRPHNFAQGISLGVDELAAAYRAYEVLRWDSTQQLFIIKPRKCYRYARMFTRLIQFDERGKQESSVTIPDFEYQQLIATKDGFLLGLNDFGHGASTYFRNASYAWKVIRFNKNLEIMGEFATYQRSAEIVGIRSSNEGFSAKLEIHTICDGCFDTFCYAEVIFDESLQPKELVITQQPRDFEVSSDSLLKIIQEHRL